MYEIVYFSDDVLDDIRKWPLKIRVNYFRVTSLMEIQGHNLGMPHTKAFGKGLFEIKAGGAEGFGRAFFVRLRGKDCDSSRFHKERYKNTKTRP